MTSRTDPHQNQDSEDDPAYLDHDDMDQDQDMDMHLDTSTATNNRTPSSHDPSEDSKKRASRKPGPTCPALRKEQNRAAQRAFRDRKERHLHQLENMIKDLKDQHFLVTSRYQRQVHHLKIAIESLQSENYYLREVVFAFESALSKGRHVSILEDVKQELYHRHYEARAAAKLKATDPSADSPSISISGQHPTPPTPPEAAPSEHNSPPTTTLPPAAPLSNSSTALVNKTASLPQATVKNPPDDHFLSMNGDILYKAPPLFVPVDSEPGQIKTILSPFEPLSVPRPAYVPPGTNLPKHTEYTKHPTVFDELQSSLFPPGTLQSLQIAMATPQEVVSDSALFDQMQDSSHEFSLLLNPEEKPTSGFLKDKGGNSRNKKMHS